MKKFAIVLLVVFFSSISLAHIGHYNKFDKIEMEILRNDEVIGYNNYYCLLYTSPSPRDVEESRMPSSA